MSEVDELNELDGLDELNELDGLDGSDGLDEFNQIIDNCQKLCSDAEISTKILINISHNVVKDFDELLKELHLIALDNIKKTGYNTFGEQLLDALSRCTV